MNNKEIDQLIAEKVLGWKVYNDDLGFSVWTDQDDNWHGDINDFQPSSRIEQTWEIVEKLKQVEQYYFKLENGDLYGYECTFTDYFTHESYCAAADTAPMAICKAALNAKGVTI